MLFKIENDAVDVLLRIIIFCAHCLKLIALLLEESEQTLFLLLAEGLKLADKISYHLARFAEFLGLDICERAVGEFAELRLALGAVVHDEICIGDVDFFRKGFNHLLLFRSQIRSLSEALFDLLIRQLNGLYLFGLGDGIKGQYGGVLFFHGNYFLSYFSLLLLFTMPSRTSISVEMSSASSE